MVFMYAGNSLRNGWWENVHIIIWGATAKLVCENADVRKLIAEFQAEGGRVSACQRCLERLGLKEQMQSVPGVAVYYVGESFTESLQGPDTVLTV